MAPPRKDIKDTPGWKIYQALLKYVDTEQMIPNVNAFFLHLVEQGVLADTEKSVCRYYMERRFVDDGLIQFNHKMHTFRLLKRKIIPLETKEESAEEDIETPIVKKRLQDWA